MNQPSQAVAAAIARRQSQASETDSIDVIRTKAREAKDLELHIADLEEQLKQSKAQLFKICTVDLVDLMSAHSVDGVDVSAQGNMPAFTAKMKPYYKAAIYKDDPEEKRIAAFAMLEETGNADLITTTVTVDFPREARAEVAAFIAQLPKTITHTVEANVRWTTLTKWLRETVEGGQMPDLELINGFVGQKVELKDKK